MSTRYTRLLILLAGALIGTQAYAADLPYKAPTYKAPAYTPEVVAPELTWNGFYVGANVGYGWADFGVSGASENLNGVIGGLQIGYNWQFGNYVLGAEADVQGSGENKSDSTTVLGTTFTIDQKIKWFGTARARLGYAFGPWMVYATGGAAWQNYELSVSAGGGSLSDNTTKIGWTAGGGLEWMFMPRWSAKAEYLYMDTGNTDLTLFGTTFNAQITNNIGRVGINYHF